MDAKDLLNEALRAEGFDGLCNPDYECGCDREDLQPCEGGMMNCEGAYKVRCPNCGDDMYVIDKDNIEDYCPNCG